MAHVLLTKERFSHRHQHSEPGDVRAALRTRLEYFFGHGFQWVWLRGRDPLHAQALWMGNMYRTYKTHVFFILIQIFPHSITSLCHFPRVYRISHTPKHHQNGFLISSENKSTSLQTNTLTTGWWFGTCFIFHNIWDVPSYWRTHIFQDGYCTTNQTITSPKFSASTSSDPAQSCSQWAEFLRFFATDPWMLRWRGWAFDDSREWRWEDGGADAVGPAAHWAAGQDQVHLEGKERRVGAHHSPPFCGVMNKNTRHIMIKRFLWWKSLGKSWWNETVEKKEENDPWTMHGLVQPEVGKITENVLPPNPPHDMPKTCFV